MREIYLDNNATTQPAQAVVEAMLPFFQRSFGNPAAAHGRGRRAAASVARATESVARLLGCTPRRVVWTSGATEALNLGMKGVARVRPGKGVVVTAGEHKAVLDTAEALVAEGSAVIRKGGLSASGEVDYHALQAMIDENTVLVCVQAANNETGVINDIRRVVELAHERRALVLCDATQQVGKMPLNLTELGVDLAAASAHKLYGPQGVGILVRPEAGSRVALEPLIHGGGHQGGLRSGTLNLPGIVGFGVAAQLAQEALKQGEPERIAGLRDRLERQLEKHAGPVTINGQDAPRLPNTTNVRIHGVDSEALIVNCPKVAMSSGSACTSAVPQPSHVLMAVGLSAREAEESVRFSLGRYTTEEEVDQAAELVGAAARRIREVNA